MSYGLIGYNVSDGHAPTSSVWMATPDTLAFSVDDPPIIPGNIVTGSFSGNAYETWFQMTNPSTGNTEYCCPFGPSRDRVRFSDLPPSTSYKDKIALRTLANYTVTGATLSAVYYRDEAIGHGFRVTASNGSGQALITQRHTVYLKLSAALSNGAVLTISNSQPNTFSQFSFTFNDKVIRAGGIQVNQVGHRPDDALRYAYLAVRIPGAVNNGTVDFINTHGFSSFQILNSAKASVFTGSVVQRVAANEREQIASFTGFIDDGTGGGSPSGVAGNKLTVTELSGGMISPIGNVKVVSADAALSGATVGISSFVSGINGGVGVYTVSSTLNLGSQAMWCPDGYPLGIDVADLSQGWDVTAATKAVAGTNRITVVGHGFTTGDKCRFFGINGMTQLEGPPNTTNTSLWFSPTVTVIDADTISIDVNTTNFTTFANTTLLSAALGGVNNKVYKCFNTNRAGTYVFGLDFSSWTPSASGIYYIYIPGYGISDPFQIKSDIWAQAAAKTHQGLFNLRLGCAVSSDSGYSRGSCLVDGVGGVTNYESTLPAMFCSEGGQAIIPAGSSGLIYAGMGGYSNEGTLTITTLSCSGTTATANTSGSIGLTNGTVFYAQILGCSPSGYNTGGTTNAACTVQSSTSFSYIVGSSQSAGTGGFAITGFITTTRTGGRPGHQDAGDNDDLAVDHIPAWKTLSLTFLTVPKPSRFTPYTVPLSSSVLDHTLFSGTDALPPLFHEMFWYAEAYRTTQAVNGSVLGGYGYSGNVNSQSPVYPETIDYYRGNDAAGSASGQTVMGFAYARDHLTTMLYAGLAAQLAIIAYDYGLTALGDAYKASAIAAYSWADGLATSPSTCDTYYKTTLNLKTKAGWSEATYQDAMKTLNTFNGRAILAKADAAGALYRLLGSSAGQTPYGDFIEQRCIVSAPTIANAGSGYAVSDIIVLSGGTAPVSLLVTAVSGGAITSVAIMNQGQFSSAPTNPVSQASTTGSGTGAQFNLSTFPYYTQMAATIGAINYCATPGANSTAKSSLQSGFSSNNPDINLSPKLSYMGMLYNVTPLATTIGTLAPQATLRALGSHINYVAVNGIVAGAYSSKYIKLMQAQCSHVLGANFQGRAFQTGVGQRSSKLLLHEDSWKMGKLGPDGILPFGYNGWAVSLMFTSFVGSLQGSQGQDSISQYISDNVSGQWESASTPGSAKMWNPWRGGSSYWEWAPENHGIIYNSEFSQLSMLETLSIELYLHGWDGNT